MRTSLRMRMSRAAVAILVLTSLTSCASTSRRTKGAVIGAGAGAVAGGVIGKHAGSTTKGAIIGAVVGGAAGAIIGHQMDQQAKELEQNIPGAVVERVGEGIHVTFASGLLFGFDSDDVRGEAMSNLNALAASLNRYSDSDLMIVGHTDAVGSSSYNQDLSERRSYAASSYLRSRGVSRQIAALGAGEAEPLETNETEAGRRLNRRVEVAIYASQKLQAAAQREAGER